MPQARQDKKENALSLTTRIATPIFKRNFLLEITIILFSLISELLLNSLKSTSICRKLFPTATVCANYIQYGNLLILRTSIRTLIKTSTGLCQCFLPTGTVLRNNNNRWEIVHRTDNISSPILDAFANMNNFINTEYAANHAKNIFEKHRPEWLLASTNTEHVYHKVSDSFLGNTLPYLVLEPVSNVIPQYIFQPASPLVKFQPSLDVVFDDAPCFYNPSIQDNAYSFNDENRVLTAQALQYKSGGNKCVVLPACRLLSNEANISWMHYQLLNPMIPPWNASEIYHSPDKFIILSASLQFANALQQLQFQVGDFSFVASSWIGDVKSMDLSYFRDREVLLLTTPRAGHSAVDYRHIVPYINNNLPESTQIDFIAEGEIEQKLLSA